MSEGKETEPRKLEIEFGSVFEPDLEGKVSKHVVIDVGEGKQFFSSSFWEEDDKLLVGIPGTSELQNIKRVLDEKLTVEEIIEGMKNDLGAENVSENMINMVREASEKGPRVIRS